MNGLNGRADCTVVTRKVVEQEGIEPSAAFGLEDLRSLPACPSKQKAPGEPSLSWGFMFLSGLFVADADALFNPGINFVVSPAVAATP